MREREREKKKGERCLTKGKINHFLILTQSAIQDIWVKTAQKYADILRTERSARNGVNAKKKSTVTLPQGVFHQTVFYCFFKLRINNLDLIISSL